MSIKFDGNNGCEVLEYLGRRGTYGQGYVDVQMLHGTDRILPGHWVTKDADGGISTWRFDPASPSAFRDPPREGDLTAEQLKQCADALTASTRIAARAVGVAVLPRPPEADKGFLEGTVPAAKWSTRLEGGCPACVAKHLSQAILLFEAPRHWVHPMTRPSDAEVLLGRAVILDHEAHAGYRGHRYLVAGCLAAAEDLLRREHFHNMADEIRQIRLWRIRHEGSLLHRIADTTAFFGPETEENTMAWAHVDEAYAELPTSDLDNRNILRVGFPVEKAVQELTRVLKNVVETYALEPS